MGRDILKDVPYQDANRNHKKNLPIIWFMPTLTLPKGNEKKIMEAKRVIHVPVNKGQFIIDILLKKKTSKISAPHSQTIEDSDANI